MQPPQQHWSGRSTSQSQQRQQRNSQSPQPRHRSPSGPRQQSSSSSSQPPPLIGPRGKCDQVIYEAMAKACEIAARGRCTRLPDDDAVVDGAEVPERPSGGRKTWTSPYPSQSPSSSSPARRSFLFKSYSNREGGLGGAAGGGGGGNNNNNNASGGGSTSSRFNIEVEEVEGVRSIMQSWKRSLHIPLRLDIYYEHDPCYNTDDDDDDGCGGTNGESGSLQQQQQQDDGGDDAEPPPPKGPQRELLERWCIDYVPSTDNDMSASSMNDKSSHIAQLRRVCKRVVVLLRSLHCMTRLLPAFRLRCLLLMHGVGGSGGGNATAGVGGIGGSSSWVGGVNGGGGNNSDGVEGGWGSIGYSIHAAADRSDRESLPSPAFVRQAFPAVPTPYGTLRLTVAYDATLKTERMMGEVAERRARWLERRWAAQHPHQHPFPQHLHHQNQPQPPQQYYRGDAQHTHAPYPNANPYGTPGGTATPSMPIPIHSRAAAQPHQAQRACVSSLPSAAMLAANQRLLMAGNVGVGSPLLQGTASPAVSDFIIPNYHADRSPSIKPVPCPEMAGGGNYGGGNGGGGGGNGGNAPAGVDKRVMSGLSLAMMAEEENRSNNGGATTTATAMNQRSSSPSSLIDDPGKNVDEHSIRWKSRAAFHHPPPTYSDVDGPAPPMSQQQYHQQQQQQSQQRERASSNGSKSGTHFFQSRTGYGYGYNGSNLDPLDPGYPQFGSPALVPTQSSSYGSHGVGSAGGGGFGNGGGGAGEGYGLSISPSPLASTPPQSMWGKPRGPKDANGKGEDGEEGGGSSASSSQAVPPPFPSNPTSLQSVEETGMLGGTASLASTMAFRTGNSSGVGGSGIAGGQGGGSSSPILGASPSSVASHGDHGNHNTLLPPLTSLDQLRKSPFNSTHGKSHSSTAPGAEGTGEIAINPWNSTAIAGAGMEELPFAIGSYPGEAIASSSLPRTVPGAGDSKVRVSGIGGSMAFGAYSSTGGYNPSFLGNNRGGSNPAAASSFDEMPFAVDASPLASPPVFHHALLGSYEKSRTARNGSGGRSLLGGTLGPDATGGGGGGGVDVAEISSSLAVSSLHSRCATEGRPRLKMFGSPPMMESGVGVFGDGGFVTGGDGGGTLTSFQTAIRNDDDEGRDNFVDATNGRVHELASIRDQLSDFRNFGASLMIGSASDNSGE